MGLSSASSSPGTGALSGAAEGAVAGSIVPGIGTAIGAVGGAIGGLLSGISSSNMATYQAEVAAINQKIAEQNAAQDIGVGNVSAENTLINVGREIGQAKTAQAAKGIDVNTGSAVDVQNTIRTAGRESALAIRENARRAAYGQQVEGAGFGSQAQLLRQEASEAIPASIIGGISTFANKWGALQQAGALGGGGDSGGGGSPASLPGDTSLSGWAAANSGPSLGSIEFPDIV